MRQTVLAKMRSLFPSLNIKRQTWRMVERACKQLDAVLFCIPLHFDGYFISAAVSKSGKPEIYVNSNMGEDMQIATAVHEIKHAACDPPQVHPLFSSRAEWTRAKRVDLEKYQSLEYEACAVAAMSLIPSHRLRYASRGLFEPEDEFLEILWVIRLDLRSTKGI